MTVEEQLRAELASLAEQVRPMPDPLARLRRRDRRSRRIRWALSALASAAVIFAATLVTPVLAPGGGLLQPVYPVRPSWARSLVDAAPRGAVGADPTFVDAVATFARLNMRAGLNVQQFNVANSTVHVLFADDIGQRRDVLVAAVPLTGDDGVVVDRTELAWITAAAGAAPAVIAGALLEQNRTADTTVDIYRAEPFLVAQLQDTTIGIAPPGCVIAAAAAPSLTDWRDEPTESYVVRTRAAARPEYWRVTCDGVRRHEAPAPTRGGDVSDADAQRALQAAGIHTDQSLARLGLATLKKTGGYGLRVEPRVLWAGPLTPTEPDVIVVAAPRLDSAWVGLVEAGIFVSDVSPSGPAIAGFTTATDLSDPNALVAINLTARRSILVIAPAGAVRVRLVSADTTVAEAAVINRAALFDPVTDRDQVRFEALSASGAVIASGPLAADGVMIPSYDDWS